MLFFLVVVIKSMAEQGITPAYQVKAAFLYNFTRFIEWPDESFNSAGAPFIIGVIGDDQLGSFLRQIVDGEKIGNRPVIIENYHNIQDIKECNILFISSRKVPGVKSALSSLHQRNILTVSDSANFLRMGGMVRFYTERNKMRIGINLRSAKNTQLQISSKLLSIATIFNR